MKSLESRVARLEQLVQKRKIRVSSESLTFNFSLDRFCDILDIPTREEFFEKLWNTVSVFDHTTSTLEYVIQDLGIDRSLISDEDLEACEDIAEEGVAEYYEEIYNTAVYEAINNFFSELAQNKYGTYWLAEDSKYDNEQERTKSPYISHKVEDGVVTFVADKDALRDYLSEQLSAFYGNTLYGNPDYGDSINDENFIKNHLGWLSSEEDNSKGVFERSLGRSYRYDDPNIDYLAIEKILDKYKN